MNMRILITGGRGMLGRTLQNRWQIAHTLAVADLPEVDVTAPGTLAEAFRAFRPEVVLHCAAKTNVDACEGDRDGAFRLNAEGSANVARACAAHGARLIPRPTAPAFPAHPPPPPFARTQGRRRDASPAENPPFFVRVAAYRTPATAIYRTCSGVLRSLCSM